MESSSLNENLNALLDEMESNDIIDITDVPNIDLYIDQVTTFIEKNMSSYKRGTADKMLTKTMINNYTKDAVLPRPNRKKYSKEHILLLIIIYHLKQIVSLADINTIMNSENLDVSQIYQNFTRLQAREKESLRRSTAEMLDNAQDGSALFNLLLSLIIDASVKKQLAEKLIDSFFQKGNNPKDNKRKSSEQRAANERTIP
jgi:DNA-binding transcriptional MerR regulator